MTRTLLVILGFALLLICWRPLPLGAVASPQIILTPASGPCGSIVTARANGFAPGVQYRFAFFHDRARALINYNTMGSDDHISPSGTVVLNLRIVDCDANEPDGSTYTLSIWEWFPNTANSVGVGTSAVFTVNGGVLPTGLPNTGAGLMAVDADQFDMRLLVLPSGIFLVYLVVGRLSLNRRSRWNWQGRRS